MKKTLILLVCLVFLPTLVSAAQFSDSHMKITQLLEKMAIISAKLDQTGSSYNQALAAQNTALSWVVRPQPEKKSLVFNIDQNFGNGIIQKQDKVGLERTISAIKSFSPKYTVYAQVSTAASDKKKLDWLLAELTRNKVPFVLDVYTSDTITVGKSEIANPYDISHGRQLSLTQLEQYKKKYGSYFAGVRAHEVFGEHAQIVGCKKLAASWCSKFSAYIPTDDFYQKAYLEEYVKFAKQNNMFLIFSDHYWSTYVDSELSTLANQKQNELDLYDLQKMYPDTIIVLFANNEWNEAARDMIDTWPSVIQPTISADAKGFGLSNQSWMCNDETKCPAGELSSWAEKAFSMGAIMVQTEPYWYWWQLPKGQIGTQSYNYTKNSIWKDRGYPTMNLLSLAKTLEVKLPKNLQKKAGEAPSEVITKLSKPQDLRASCRVSGSGVELSWSAVDHASLYWFRVIGISETNCISNPDWQWVSAEGGTCYPKPDVGVSGQSIFFPALPGISYAWKVQASKENLYSDWATADFSCW